MKTNTSKIKKLAIGLTVVTVALVGSAFKNNEPTRIAGKAAPAEFYNTTGVASNDPADYVYDPNGDCATETTACRAEWEHSGALTPGTHPDGAKLTADEPGAYIPGI